MADPHLGDAVLPALADVPALDLWAMAVFYAAWAGYIAIADRVALKRESMASVLFLFRVRWMERMLERDNRMPDVQIISAYLRTGSLFVSTTLLLLAGSMAVLGQVENLRNIVADFSLGEPPSLLAMELRIFVLASVLVYAFFKFAWCLRQFNYALVIVGAAPSPGQGNAQEVAKFPAYGAEILGRASNNFNRGLRSYYFALAVLPWFFHSGLLFVTTVLVLGVLYRRDFQSVTQRMLERMTADVFKS